MKIEHAWFDVNGSLYEMTEDRTERLLTQMYEAIADHSPYWQERRKKGGLWRRELQREYQEHLEDRVNKRSHKLIFQNAYGLDPDLAREAQRRANIAETLAPDPKLFELFLFLRDRTIPFSYYTSSLSNETRHTLDRLGLDRNPPFQFTFRMHGEQGRAYEGKLEHAMMIKLSGIAREDAHKIIYVGDRPDMDTRPARRAGMSTALVWQKYSRNGTQLNHVEEIPCTRPCRHFRCPDVYSLKQVIQQLEQSE